MMSSNAVEAVGTFSRDKSFYERFVKRPLDVSVSLFMCVITALPLAVLCIAIRMESAGSPLFRHERIGRDGRKIRILKLRTMYADAESDMRKYLSPEQMLEWRTEHKVENDSRVTKIGRVLRKTSLDELPQFLNVLMGDMSVVGPRPVTEDELEWFGDDVGEVLSIRPGITGYWQAYARNDATWESGKRQAMELTYVRNVSAAMDARVFFRTFGAIFGLTGR